MSYSGCCTGDMAAPTIDVAGSAPFVSSLNMYMPKWLEPWRYRYTLRYERVTGDNVMQTRVFQDALLQIKYDDNYYRRLSYGSQYKGVVLVMDRQVIAPPLAMAPLDATLEDIPDILPVSVDVDSTFIYTGVNTPTPLPPAAPRAPPATASHLTGTKHPVLLPNTSPVLSPLYSHLTSHLNGENNENAGKTSNTFTLTPVFPSVSTIPPAFAASSSLLRTSSKTSPVSHTTSTSDKHGMDAATDTPASSHASPSASPQAPLDAPQFNDPVLPSVPEFPLIVASFTYRVHKPQTTWEWFKSSLYSLSIPSLWKLRTSVMQSIAVPVAAMDMGALVPNNTQQTNVSESSVNSSSDVLSRSANASLRNNTNIKKSFGVKLPSTSNLPIYPHSESSVGTYICTYGVLESLRGSGLATHMLSSGLMHMYVSHAPWNVYLHVLCDNSPAIKLYTKHGFTITEVLKDHYYFHGKYHDAYSLCYKYK